MTQVLFDDVSFGFVTPLFERLSVSFEPGWTGLIGANGSGKTTLLRLITAELSPLYGQVRIAPPSNVVWCHQQSSDQSAELERFAADTSGAAQRWRGRFGVKAFGSSVLGASASGVSRFEQLSAGERKRWQLAMTLASEPGVLLLDEPSNHLDGSAHALLSSALRRFEGIGILVSHDRALLDTLTTRTARIVAHGLELCPGNYSAASQEWRAREAATASERETLKRDRQRVDARATSQRERARSAEKDRSNRRAMKDKNDHDSRSMLRKNKAEAAGRRLARDAASLRSRVSRIDNDLSKLRVEKSLGAEIFADYVPWTKPLVMHASFDALHAGSQRLLGRTSLDIAREDKLTLEGPNGSGKTSLLRELERQNPEAFTRSVYLPQNTAHTLRAELGLALSELPPAARGQVLNIVAALGSDPGAILESSSWSPGETRKVALALGLARSAPALILDEPTNHFDLPSIERLERLLIGFPGCVVLVTHDAVLAERVATRRLRFQASELLE